VAGLRAFLVAVKALHGGVDVEDPRQGQRRADAREDVALHPPQAFVLLHALDRGAHHVLADDAVHAQQPGVDGVATHGADVGVAPVPAQDAQQGRAHDVELAAAAVAGVVQRTVGEELAPAVPCLKELEKEHQLALPGDGSLAFPLGVNRPPGVSSGQRLTSSLEATTASLFAEASTRVTLPVIRWFYQPSLGSGNFSIHGFRVHDHRGLPPQEDRPLGVDWFSKACHIHVPIADYSPALPLGPLRSPDNK